MDAHICNNHELQTTELIFNGKTYNVEATLSVLDKINNLKDDLSEITTVAKIILWLINDAIERENMMTGGHEKAVTIDQVNHLIGKSNMEYYRNIISEVMGVGGDNEPTEFDEDGNEVIVPDEVIEEYGDLPETVKNTEAETE